MSRSAPINDFEELPNKFKLFLTLFLGLLLFGTIGFSVLLDISLKQGFVYTIESLAFMFHEEGEIIKFLEIFLALFGVFVIWWIMWSTFDIIFTPHFKDFIYADFVKRNVKKMKNHNIIVGGGRTGETISLELKKNKEKYVILEKDLDVFRDLKKKGLLTILANSTNDQDLVKSKIVSAKKIYLTLPNDERNVVIALLARKLNPEIAIHVRVNSSEYEKVFSEIGVQKVVVPEYAVAKELL